MSQRAAPSAFAAGYDFPLDRFQVDAVAALEGGRSVLVAAPTGSGKTIVGEYAVWAALRDGGKCFYTTPIKALSNQKFNDLVARHGAERVGLLTGDRSVNGEAPVVVMTTEVLRNMLYEQSSTLRGLHAVVLDEVHYLADRERGAVWEEVIIQLPAAVQLACLSATVSNAEEFGAWLARVRSGCEVVISEQRPVPLDHHYAIGDRMYAMFRSGHAASGRVDRGGRRGRAARGARGGVPNPEVVMLERQATATRRGRGRRGGGHGGVRLRPPRRSALVRMLEQRRWLPAIVFIFSRAGCDR
ncbi:MAG TPA: DEAD/DEAH box helicase, partial [Euzebyales bacterium]|nr:DEAD/DEAH box helicase [Euzebyales bacterium]